MRIEIPASADSPVQLFVLEPHHVSDEYVAWLNSLAVNRYLESRFAPHTIESTREFVQTMLASPQHLFLGIHSAALGRHVGNLKLGPIDRHHGSADIGILVGDPEAWGRGVATAAIRQLVEIARDMLRLRKLTAGCYVSNIGSQRAFEKVGFALEGLRKAQFLLDGKPEDLVQMGLVLREP